MTSERQPSDSALRRFERSMVIDYEKWHDGIGYDLDALRDARPAERDAIESMVVRHAPRGWRDVEALAALDTPRARAALREASADADAELRMAVARYAPGLLSEDARAASLVRALREAVVYGGLTQALAEAENLHPPAVIDALLDGAMRREGEVAVHFAALLVFLHGKAAEPFDMAQRPFFLRFHTEDSAERERAFRDLCARIGVDADPYVAGSAAK